MMVSAEVVKDRRDVKVMEGTPSLTIPFGLLELDATGAVRRYTPAKGRATGAQASEILGRNFFNEVLPVEEVKDCRARFYCFMAHGVEVHNYDAFFLSECGQVKVQVMLTYVGERSDRMHERLAFVRVMPGMPSDVP